MKILFPVLSFYFKKNWILVFLILITIPVVYYFITDKSSFLPEAYQFFWDPSITIFSVLFTIGLTVVVVRREWLDSLPQRIIVHFTNSKGLYIASCYNVNLMPNADSRALGLQVGQQILKTQHLKINPSIQLIDHDNPIKILTKENKTMWIKYSTLVFGLNAEDHNDETSDYIVWSIEEDETLKLITNPSVQSFDILHHIGLQSLLSDDIVSRIQFEKERKERPMTNTLYVTNSPIIDGSGVYDYATITLADAKNIMSDKPFVSAIGHESTAEVMSELLDLEIKYNRMQIKLKEGDQCLVFKVIDRIEEGKVYDSNALKSIKTELALLTKRKAES